MAAEPGQRVGDYEVLAQLGVGGMGRVYRVRNVISNREEAMKVLHPDFAADAELAARFMAEIRTLATLEHPGIAQLRTAFQFDNQFIMVMEFVEGVTLEKLAAQIRIPLDHAVDYTCQVLAALSYAHGRGVTHRDIKPANIMITTHGLVKLMDFGIAKSKEDMQLTRPGTTMGSVYYMSPEQVRGGTVDARSDLYSLGVTLYEVLTGKRPFQADTSYSVLDAQLNKAPTPPIEVNPALPAELNAIVLRAMEKQPENRFQTADEFRAALKEVVKAASLAAPAMGVDAGTMPIVPAAQAAPLGASSPYAQPLGAGPQAATPPPFTPVPPVQMPVRAQSASHRGLWIGLGAGLALLALVAVSLLLPRMFATHAKQKAGSQTPPPVQTQSPAVTPVADSGTPPAVATPAVATAGANPEVVTAVAAPVQPPPGNMPSASAGPRPQARAAKARPPYVVSPSSGAERQPQGAVTSEAAAPAAPKGPSAAEVRGARDRYSNLQARADAATGSLQTLRRQQQAQGLDLRGDMVSAMSRLQTEMAEAQRALDRNDLATAADYMEKAEQETARLEKFLGR